MGRVRSFGLRASRGIGWRLTLAGTRLSARAVTEGEGSRYEAELKGGQCLPVGRTRYKALREMLR